MNVIVRLPRETWCCPDCGAPIFGLTNHQETPQEATKLGIEREEIKLCYCCLTVHVVSVSEKH